MMNKNDHPHGLYTFLLTAVLLFTFLTQTVSAVPDDPSAYPTVPVYLDGHDTGARAYVLEDGVTYMTLRGAAPILFPGAEITWDSKGGTASLKTKNLELTAVWGQPYITANGRYFALSSLYPAENKLVNGVTYIPLRLLARAAGADIAWNGSARRVEITGG
ncbi:MAG: copper amine oxidase N-terminal domain-containing protein, partial [Clostridia bacterium]|nr:copper amine oxidase N-terminal domain-containing protein [Clostridia bacterium]